MHFPELSEMGHHYAAEEGTEGVRRMVLNSYAAALTQLQMDLGAAKLRAAPQTATGSVQARIAFFQNGTGTAQRETAAAEVKEIERKIEGVRAKLQRQGGVLLPNGSVDWVQTSRQVVYDHTALTQGLTRLHPHNGLFYTNANHVTLFDTTGMVTAFGGKGWAIYVMSDTGNIHASAHSVGFRHHSSLLAGSNVAGAGEIRVMQGKLVHISNKSGHYAPAVAHFLQVFHVLNKRGVSLMNTKVTLKTATGQDEYTSVATFMADLRTKGLETDYEFVKMMAYLKAIPYPVFQPLATANGWRWGTPMDFAVGSPAAGGRGVVRIADGTQVPHKDVRRWLKGLGHQLGTTIQPAVQSGAAR
jgi:hypothetical protein